MTIATWTGNNIKICLLILIKKYYQQQKTAQAEEKEVHESYQILLMEYHARKAVRERKHHPRLEEAEILKFLEAEAARCKAEAEKMRAEMMKYTPDKIPVSIGFWGFYYIQNLLSSRA